MPIQFLRHVAPFLSDGWDQESHFEPVGSEPIHTGIISKCAAFWRKFVKSKWLISWVDNRYDLVWNTTPPSPRELRSSKFSLDNQEFVTKAVNEMLVAGAVSALIGRSSYSY
jgi:hypothetical protein